MKKKILVVDDSRFVYEEIKNMVDDSDFEVAGYCSSGEEVLDKYKEISPDIVTMDIIMPGMDGLETSGKLLEEFPDAKIIIVSSLDYEETEEKAAELGIKTFIFKPFEREDLLLALKFMTEEENE